MAARTGSLRRYLVIRLALVIPNIFVLLTLVFLLLRVAPGDPIQAAMGSRLSADQLAARRAAAGYDRPMIVQFWEYLTQIFKGQLGNGLTDGRPVTDILIVNGAATLTLTLAAVIVALAVGVPLGLVGARFRNSWADVAVRLLGVLTYAAPVFFVGVLSIILFTGVLHWLPSGLQSDPIYEFMVPVQTHFFLIDALLAGNTDAFINGLQHLILPAVTLGLLVAGVFIRLVRVNVTQTLRDDYIEAARARGIPERKVVYDHAFRNAMVPFVTVLGLQVALLLGGAILTETTFSWPGIGSELVRYINSRDYVVVQGIMVIFAIIVALASLIIDIVNALIDPRVRY